MGEKEKDSERKGSEGKRQKQRDGIRKEGKRESEGKRERQREGREGARVGSGREKE